MVDMGYYQHRNNEYLFRVSDFTENTYIMSNVLFFSLYSVTQMPGKTIRAKYISRNMVILMIIWCHQIVGTWSSL